MEVGRDRTQQVKQQNLSIELNHRRASINSLKSIWPLISATAMAEAVASMTQDPRPEQGDRQENGSGQSGHIQNVALHYLPAGDTPDVPVLHHAPAVPRSAKIRRTRSQSPSTEADTMNFRLAIKMVLERSNNKRRDATQLAPSARVVVAAMYYRATRSRNVVKAMRGPKSSRTRPIYARSWSSIPAVRPLACINSDPARGRPPAPSSQRRVRLCMAAGSSGILSSARRRITIESFRRREELADPETSCIPVSSFTDMPPPNSGRGDGPVRVRR